MKPKKFTYCRPDSLDEALALLAQHGDAARVLAGGQSLVPMMRLRLASPDALVDLSGLDELTGIRQEGGEIVIGAMTWRVSIAVISAPLSDQATRIGPSPSRARSAATSSTATCCSANCSATASIP